MVDKRNRKYVYVYMAKDGSYLAGNGRSLDEARKDVLRVWRAEHGSKAPATATYERHADRNEDRKAALSKAVAQCRRDLNAHSENLW